MSDNLKNCINVLTVVSKIKNAKLRRKLLAEFGGDECLYKALKEISVNTFKKNIKLTHLQKKKLQKFKKDIFALTKPEKSKLKRKRLIIQSGGFLPILIPAAITILSKLLNNK